MQKSGKKYFLKKSPLEDKLNELYYAGVLKLTMGAMVVWDLAPADFEKEVRRDKFFNYYNAWRRQALGKLEEARTGNISPPAGENCTKISFVTPSLNTHDLFNRCARRG